MQAPPRLHRTSCTRRLAKKLFTESVIVVAASSSTKYLRSRARYAASNVRSSTHCGTSCAFPNTFWYARVCSNRAARSRRLSTPHFAARRPCIARPTFCRVRAARCTRCRVALACVFFVFTDALAWEQRTARCMHSAASSSRTEVHSACRLRRRWMRAWPDECRL